MVAELLFTECSLCEELWLVLLPKDLLYHFTFMHLHVGLNIHACTIVMQVPRQGLRSPGTGVSGGCEAPGVDAGKPNPRSSARAAHALNCRATSSAWHNTLVINLNLIVYFRTKINLSECIRGLPYAKTVIYFVSSPVIALKLLSS